MTAEEIESSEGLVAVLRRQSRALLAMQSDDPRAAGIFATQQRWLLAHLAFSMYFQCQTEGRRDDFRLTHFLTAVVAHGVASRNTADAFIKQMQKYGFLQAVASFDDRRVRPLIATDMAIRPLDGWLRVHLGSLDQLDGGDRLPRYSSRPDSIARIHPLIAQGLLQSAAVREPAPTFSLFTWMNEGGVMMDWLYAGLEDFGPHDTFIRTQVKGYSDFSGRIRLSKSHLARKLGGAETIGSLVWAGARGASEMSVSMRFVREYHAQQSAKLAVIDDAVGCASDHGFV